MSNNTQLCVLIKEFNELLTVLCYKIKFCQHDSEYRIEFSERKENAMKRITEILELYPDFCDNVYLYITKPYKLKEYMYGWKLTEQKHYASNSFACVDKNIVDNYCAKYGLDHSKYVIGNDGFKIHTKTFSEFMDQLIHKYNYQLPTRIEILNEPLKDNSFHNTYYGLKSFKYIDIFKLRDNICTPKF